MNKIIKIGLALGAVAWALLGSTSANATVALAVTGSEPGCLTVAGGQYTDCTSSFTPSALLDTTNGFAFSVTFANQSFVETLVANTLQVGLFFNPGDFPLELSNGVVTLNELVLLDEVGNALTISYGGLGVVSSGLAQSNSASAVAAGTIITGLRLSLSCANAVAGFEGACDSGLTFTGFYLNMDTAQLGVPSLRAGRLATVPEPATLALFGLGLAGLGAVRRKRLVA
jgi:hypothetical protein